MIVQHIEKPWGHEEWIEVNNDYVVKRLVVEEGKSTSLQYHQEKTETMYILSGTAFLRYGNEQFTLSAGDHIHIPKGTIHQLTGLTQIQVLETSTPELDDVVRLS